MVTVSQLKYALYSRDLRDKREEEHKDEGEATFKFIEGVQNCPALWDVSSAKILKTDKRKKGRGSKFDRCGRRKVDR